MFIDKIKETFSAESTAKIEAALHEAEAALSGLTRYDGTPLLAHSLAGAEIVVGEIGLGRNSTIAMLLHDAVRLGLIDIATTEQRYGAEVGAILRGLNLISGIHTNTHAEQVDNFREMIVSCSSDPRVILIKLADRVEVMRNLAMFPDAKQRKKSWETMHLYAPIAHKLGLYTVKSELEDLALQYLESDDYAHIAEKLAETAAERESFIADFVQPIELKLNELGYKFHIKGRTKSVYSVWRKMHRTGVTFEQVYDLFAIRIIIECPPADEKQACWGVYSVVTDFYTPNPERLRDWISIPKSNGYESLHTTVVTADGRWVEIQIRTERMDAVAERGIAAHWRYKGVGGSTVSHEQWLARIRESMEEDAQQLPERLDAAASGGEIFVFTPKGDLHKLPEGATVLDFAFAIHSGVGERCTGAQIGERVVPIKEVLHNGDIINILTAKNQHPKADWLKIVKTPKARSRIRLCLREEREKQARLGREELERKLKNWKLAITIDDAVTTLCRYLKLRTGMELYGQIASEKLSLNEVHSLLERHLAGELFTTKARATGTVQVKPAAESDTLIIDETIRGIQYKMARCCNPVRGDRVFGFTTISNGITIHRLDCPNSNRLHEQYPYRIIEARWREGGLGNFLAKINIVADETPGIVGRITDYVSNELKLNIRSMSLSPSRDGLRGTITVEVPSAAVLNTLLFNLAKLRGIVRAYRITN